MAEPKPLDWQSFRKSELRPVVKDGVRRINGRQVNLLIALGHEAGKSGQDLLEFIEFGCGYQVAKLEDVNDGDMMQQIVAKLKGEKVR